MRSFNISPFSLYISSIFVNLAITCSLHPLSYTSSSAVLDVAVEQLKQQQSKDKFSLCELSPLTSERNLFVPNQTTHTTDTTVLTLHRTALWASGGE